MSMRFENSLQIIGRGSYASEFKLGRRPCISIVYNFTLREEDDYLFRPAMYETKPDFEH